MNGIHGIHSPLVQRANAEMNQSSQHEQPPAFWKIVLLVPLTLVSVGCLIVLLFGIGR